MLTDRTCHVESLARKGRKDKLCVERSDIANREERKNCPRMRSIRGGDEGWKAGRGEYDGEKEGDGARLMNLLLWERVIFIE